MCCLRTVVSCAILTAGLWKGADSWTAQLLSDLSPEITSNFLTMLTNGTVDLLADCSNSNNASQVQFWLFTRKNPDNYIVIKSSDQINVTKPVIVLMHGWGGNGNIGYIRVIKDAYIKRYDCNIVSVQYEMYTEKDYQTSYCYLPAIALEVAKFICRMGINVKNLHLLGHSLGGQLAGLVGEKTQKICGTVGRITGLDPAGPLYQGINTSDRLDASDAEFVDVIHTNQAQFGYTGNCGGTDFYPNCGYFQPGCYNLRMNASSNISDIIGVPISHLRCSHNRSCYLFAESINNNSFYSTNCKVCGTASCIKDMFNPSHSYMGESCRSKQKYSAYKLKTNAKAPYALGPEGPLN